MTGRSARTGEEGLESGRLTKPVARARIAAAGPVDAGSVPLSHPWAGARRNRLKRKQVRMRRSARRKGGAPHPAVPPGGLRLVMMAVSSVADEVVLDVTGQKAGARLIVDPLEEVIW